MISNRKNRAGLFVLMFLLLSGLYGEFQTYYIKKSGVYIAATVLDVGPAPRGYKVHIQYSYMNKRYNEIISTTGMELANEKNIGKRLIISILPNYPTLMAYIDYAPDCLGDNPPEGWTEIPKCE